MAEGPNIEVLNHQKHLKWSVSEYFGYIKNGQGVVQEDRSPICKTCRRKVAAKGFNTSNLMQYLRDHHPAILLK